MLCPLRDQWRCSLSRGSQCNGGNVDNECEHSSDCLSALESKGMLVEVDLRVFGSAFCCPSFSSPPAFHRVPVCKTFFHTYSQRVKPVPGQAWCTACSADVYQLWQIVLLHSTHVRCCGVYSRVCWSLFSDSRLFRVADVLGCAGPSKTWLNFSAAAKQHLASFTFAAGALCTIPCHNGGQMRSLRS